MLVVQEPTVRTSLVTSSDEYISSESNKKQTTKLKGFDFKGDNKIVAMFTNV